MKSLFSKTFVFFWFVFSLAFLIKGQKNNPYTYQQNLIQDLGGPYESSNSNSRYALVKSIVENNSFDLNTDLARFSSPDVSKKDDKYFSTFTPGVSLLAAPLYILGEYLKIPQITTYALNIILAFVNVVLIYSIIRKLKFNHLIALLSGAIFIFATNAFTYAGTLTQHHAVTSGLLFLILISLYPITLISNFLFGLVWGLGLLMDIPFALISLPILANFLYRHFNFYGKNTIPKIDWRILLAGLGLLFPIIIFANYNQKTTGSYLTLAQSMSRTKDFRATSVDAKAEDLVASISAVPSSRSLFSTYNPRLMIEGLYTLVISDERGLFYYSPILLIAILGIALYLQVKTKNELHPALTAALIGIVSYSMFGDPWGGWSFGPRYMIPTTAIFCLFIPFALAKFIRSKIFSLIFIVLIFASVYINVSAGLTTNLIPPEQEAKYLTTKIPDTYAYNWQLLRSGNTHSLLYFQWFSKILSPLYFYYLLAGSISILLSLIYFISKHEITNDL